MKIKSLITAAMVLVVSTQAQAFSMTRAQTIEYCSEASKIGVSIMRARQGGLPIDRVLGAPFKEDPDLKSHILMREFVVKAYAYPGMATDEARRRMVSDFSAESFNICMRFYNQQ